MRNALDRARHAMSRMRQRSQQLEPVTALGAFGGGATAGALERSGMLPTSLGGIPVKPVIAGLLLLTAPRSSTIGAALRGAGYGIAGAYGYNSGKSGTLIAGEDEIGADGEDSMLGLGE
jgi:hypothetical protein